MASGLQAACQTDDVGQLIQRATRRQSTCGYSPAASSSTPSRRPAARAPATSMWNRSPTCAVDVGVGALIARARSGTGADRAFDIPVVRVEDDVEIRGQAQPVEEMPQPAVGVRHHDQREAEGAKPLAARAARPSARPPTNSPACGMSRMTASAASVASQSGTPACSSTLLKYIQPRVLSVVAPTTLASSISRLAKGSAAASAAAEMVTPLGGERRADAWPRRVAEDAARIEKQRVDVEQSPGIAERSYNHGVLNSTARGPRDCVRPARSARPRGVVEARPAGNGPRPAAEVCPAWRTPPS